MKDKIQKLKQLLKEEKLDGVLISSVSNISYLTGYTNFSKDEREAYLLIGKDFQYIITDGRYAEAIKKQVPNFKLFERGHKNPTENLFKSLKEQIKFLGVEEDNLTVSEHRKIKKHFKRIKHFNINKLRSIKGKEEIKKIEKACQIGDLAFEYILKNIKAGVTEKQIAHKLENFIKEKGAQISFPPIVAFGKNSSIPHHQTGQSVLGPSTRFVVRQALRPRAQGRVAHHFARSGREAQIVLLDFGVKFENYCSDMTRTVFFGKPNEKQIKIYKTVLGAQTEAVDFINSAIKSGRKIKAPDVDKIVRKFILSRGYPTIPHSLGHGIGLEVHEHPYLSPKNKEDLKEGMVFSIEPGIYIPDFGGVRIEDLFVLRKESLEQLTVSSKELIVIQ